MTHPAADRDLLDDVLDIADGEILEPPDEEDDEPNPKRRRFPVRIRNWWRGQDVEDET